ncbi:hypothetical protein N7517_007044 [Penicillium concentricum]|uniref:Uncharacterized protein n=1 Tax=Penicillium concentricum TaxID=293559 RepID=A0A9W9VAK1_9EURO|nr:uncharacterized protein N7517_007044 [Penicillium concentricum]KAJ5375038.1 hypothetical protein N7517_007044 [Penicillium concentricum]
MSTCDETVWATILAPNDAVILQESRFVGPPLSDRTRRIHKRRLNRSSDQEEQHLSLSPVSSTSRFDPFVGMPEHLISLATPGILGTIWMCVTHSSNVSAWYGTSSVLLPTGLMLFIRGTSVFKTKKVKLYVGNPTIADNWDDTDGLICHAYPWVPKGYPIDRSRK